MGYPDYLTRSSLGTLAELILCPVGETASLNHAEPHKPSALDQAARKGPSRVIVLRVFSSVDQQGSLG